MFNEGKLLFDNIKRFRKFILNESVDNDRIVKVINANEYVYIYYAGDNTISKGFRIVRPFVLGSYTRGSSTGNTGKMVLRAWEEKGGNSDSFYELHGKKKRLNHDYFTNYNGVEPGWRLFFVDKITQMLPTGKTFDLNEDGIPPLYNPDDKDMSNIIAAIPMVKPKAVSVTGLDSLNEPDKYSQQIDKNIQNKDKSKFYDFSAGKAQKQIVKSDVETIFNLISKVKKKNPRNYIVVSDNNGNFVPKLTKFRNSISKDAYVGDLYDLYSRLVIPTQPTPISFFKQVKDSKIDQLDKKNQSF